MADVPAAIRWYQAAFSQATRQHLADFDFTFLQIGPVSLELVLADEKVGSGPAGTVIYWAVEDFDASLAHFLSLGAVLYRGPLPIQDGLRMAQVRDPWGNCIGLRGL